MNETSRKVTEPRKKKAANQTQGREVVLAKIEAETSIAYLNGLGFYESLAGWENPVGMKLPKDFVVRNKDGVVSSTIEGNIVSGYALINWLVLNSLSKGIHLVMTGALVINGILPLTIYTELENYMENDFKSGPFKLMEVVKKACKAFADNPHVALKAVGTEQATLPPEPTANDVAIHNKTPDNNNDESLPATSGESDLVSDTAIVFGIYDSQQDLESTIITEEPHSSDEGDVDAPDATNYNSSDDIDEMEIPALLKAFNGGVMSERSCLKRGRRNLSDQFCYEIQLGRLLLKKKQDLKSPRLYFVWKEENFPEDQWGKAFLSRCFRYGVFEQRMKSKRGLLLQEIDVKNCKKKAMLLIGGYKKKNADKLVDKICALLDNGKVVNEEVASKLVNKSRKQLEKPKDDESTPPALPATVQELFDLPKKCLSSYGKKHLAEFHELLHAIEQVIKSSPEETALVMPLVRMFTVF